MSRLLARNNRDRDTGCGGLGVAESDGALGEGDVFGNGGESERAIWGEFEAEIVGEAAHGPAGVDFADAMPGEALGSPVEKGVDANRALVIEVGKNGFQRGEDFLFGRGENFVGDEAGLPGGESGGGFGG